MSLFNVKGQEFQITGKLLRIMKLKDEWTSAIEDPEPIISSVADANVGVDLFNFRQPIPEIEPKYTYPMEWEEIAVIPITSYDHWLNEQISPGAKRAVKKAAKKNVEVKLVDFSDELVKGIMAISNETPIRQGRPYPHFGKSFETMKDELSKGAAKCDFIGAYLGNELIGFIQLSHGKGYVVPFGMVSKIEHRDKSPQNALLSKAVEICEQKGIHYIFYGFWSRGGLGEFKQHNGCIRMAVPRYYIPLTVKGKVALKLRLHRSLATRVPEGVKDRWIRLRSKWYAKKYSK